MILLRNLIWIWTITYVIDLLWFKFNPNFILKYYKDSYDYFDYNFYKILLYVVTLIGAPIIAIPIVFGETYIILRFLPYRIKLLFQIWTVKNKTVRKELRRKLREL